MELINLTITRSAGSWSHDFDLDTFTPPLTAAATDEVKFSIDEKSAPRITKRSVNIFGGSADEIAISTGTNIYTPKLSETEKNSLPDTGYNYKLYRAGVVIAYGTITVSGSFSSGGVTPAPVSKTNGKNVTDTAIDLDLGLNHDYIFVDTTSADVTIKLLDPAVDGMSGAIYNIKRTAGSNNVIVVDQDDVELITINDNNFHLFVVDVDVWEF